MQAHSFKLTVHMASSLDGYIAKKDNSVEWFDTSSSYENGIELTADQTKSFLDSINCYVMGAHTYEHAIALASTYGWAYADTPMIVVSHRKLPLQHSNVEIYSGDLMQLVNEKLKTRYNNVWVAGGAMLAREFIRLQLADEIRLSVLPIILGEGIPLFDDYMQEQALYLKESTAYKNGMVEMIYGLKTGRPELNK